jgi:hypothetical protein
MKHGLNNVTNISTEDIGEMIEIHRNKHEVVAFISEPGAGKTASIVATGRKIAKSLNKRFVLNPTIEEWEAEDTFCVQVIILGTIEEIDVRGMPHVTMFNGRQLTKYSLTELFPTKGTGMVVIDEFANARTNIQNAMQDVVLEHRAGNFPISRDIQFVIATNGPQHNTGTYYIPSALRNRASWFEVVPSKLEKWLEIMEDIDPIDPRIAAWLLSIGSKYYRNFDPKAEQYGYGTMRSLHKASNLIKGVTNENLLRKLVGGRVGDDAGQDFLAFTKLTQKVDINALLKNPASISEYEDNIGLLYSISVTLVDKFVDTQSTNEAVIDILDVMKRKENGVFILKNVKNKLGRANFMTRLSKCSNIKKVATKYHQLLRGEEMEN